MIINYLGCEFFKIQYGNAVVALNPISRESGFPVSKFGADICAISNNHPDMNGSSEVDFGDKSPFLITGPGEYEIKDTFIRGFSSRTKYGGKEMNNTIYELTMEGMHIVFLGALSSTNLSQSTLESLEEVDVLITPIGGNGVLDPIEANKLAVSLEAKVVIPMHFGLGKEVGMADSQLKKFLKEIGEEDVKPIDKFTFKRKDLEGKEGEVVLLLP